MIVKNESNVEIRKNLIFVGDILLNSNEKGVWLAGNGARDHISWLDVYKTFEKESLAKVGNREVIMTNGE